MIYTALTKKAMKVCFEAHKNQVDKTGLPYVFHPFHLAEQMDDELSTVCALLHDVVEDTDITLNDLLKMGFPNDVIDVLSLLTHDMSVPYMDYVKNLSTNPTARKVKIADLLHNSDLGRLEHPTEHDIQQQTKYLAAMKLLQEE